MMVADSPSVCRARPDNTAPAPTSTKIRPPAACMARSWSANRTGWASCSASIARIALAFAGYGAAVVLLNTGTAGAANFTSAKNFSNGSQASLTASEWNAVATCNRRNETFAAVSRASSRSIWATGPATTDCCGLFWFAITHPAHSPASIAANSSAGCHTAVIAPA